MENYIKSIVVRANNGVYTLTAAATPEEWADVVEEAEAVEHMGQLCGWGYRDAYRVTVNGGDLIYFVGEGGE